MDSATPFFGAKISLISKSEIRYEGVLYTIDPKESTIALAKVRSFGTENRQADRPVPPRDEIFEFIIFRASDIKDLVVDDAPGQAASQPPQPAFEDPAIVKSTPAGGAGPSSISSSTQASSSSAAGKPTENGSSQPDSSKKPQQSASTSGAPKPAWGGVNVLNNLQNNVQQQNRPQNRVDHNQQQQQRQPRQYNQQQNMNNYNNQRQGGMGQRGGFRMQQGPQGFRGGPQGGFGPQGGQRYNNGRMGDGGQRQFGRGGMRGMGGRPGGYHYHQNRQPGPIKFAPLPDGEFDFEKAHSDFQMLEEKLKSLKLNGPSGDDSSSSSELPPIEGIPASAITVSALEEEEEIPSEPCYNKSTSFFDNISCEAVEREKGTVKRVDWKAERSLNKETFGVSSARPAHQRFFNNNRSGGGRFHNGGYGGGFNSRGRGGYNNRDRNMGGGDRNQQREQRVAGDQAV